MKFSNKVVAILTIASFSFLFSSGQAPTDYVNPFIGTGGHGHTFPGATMPFGMVQLSPDTRLEGWDGCAGYHYSDEYVYGFSHTHLSGTGVPDYCDILVMPFSGENHWTNGSDGEKGYRRKFSHEREAASPGYYKVELTDENISVELTASQRVGFHSYTYGKGETKKIIVDLKHRDDVITSWIRRVSDYEIEGYRSSKAWAIDQRLYFAMQFSEPIAQLIMNNNGIVQNDSPEVNGVSIKAILSFGSSTDKLKIKVGLSAVSTSNARKNIEAEIPGWNFDQVRSNALYAWNAELNKISVKSGSKDDLTVFYTALYHTMIAPNIYSDVDGSYLGRDFNIHKIQDNYYTVFSLWDTYRALHPLFTLIDHRRTNDFIKTFLLQYQQGGLLPVWELSSNETFCMIGNHAIPVIADAYIKGITDYDPELALNAMLASANHDHFGLKAYKKYGYIPANVEHESVSKTLEYAYNDWCIAEMAKALGKTAVADSFYRRAQNYKNMYDPASGFMRARINGAWYNPFEPREVNFNYTEANSWQYSFYVPHDMTNFMKMHGGDKEFSMMLDKLFTAESATTGREQSDITGLIGQYAHGNEPSHHIAYLYNYAGEPYKTQEKIHHIINDFYKNSPDGLIGNEDCGQMSAWAVFSAMGFYPVCPGTNQYVIGKPQFEEVTIHLENGKSFTIKAENYSTTNIYIQSVALNGLPYHKSFLEHEDMMQGGTLLFVMGNKPNKEWGYAKESKPGMIFNASNVLSAPVVSVQDFVFDKPFKVTFSSLEGETIRYTTDNSEPTEKSKLYKKPLTIDKTITLKYKAFKEGYILSKSQITTYRKTQKDISLKLLSDYAPQYSGNGENTLIDGLRGSEDFRLGGWQGFEGKDFEAIVTVPGNKSVNKLSVGFLQDINSWIFMPVKVQFYASNDGINFNFLGESDNNVSQEEWGTIIKDFSINTNGSIYKYYKITALSTKNCPPNHKGYGYPSWLFTDEITIDYK